MRRRVSLPLVVALSVALAIPQIAAASLSLLRPDPLVSGTFYGRGGISTDGWGGSGSGSLQAEVPAGSTIEYAWLYVAGMPGQTIPNATNFAGQSIPITAINNDRSGVLGRGDVTSIVADEVGTAGGVFSFAVQYPGTEGLALAVIYGNPNEPYRTIAILEGGAATTGDSATFTFAQPIDPTVEGFDATLALGITFGYQGGPGSHTCGSGQVSNVDVNGTRLTSCAGDADDSANVAGLITVGGVGDDIANPPDPNGPGGTDDELYNLVPLLHAGDTGLTVATVNPSGDDYIFLAAIAITAQASVVVTEPDPTPTPTPTADPTPTAVDDTAETTEDVALDGASVLANDLDPAAQDMTAVLVDDVTHGALDLHADGTWTYTPATNYHGADSFTYRADNGTQQSAPATASITITAANDAPITVADDVSIDQSATPSASLIDVLTNDTDVDGDTLGLSGVNQPDHGATAIVDGVISYTPDALFQGTDTFLYSVSDGHGGTAVGEVTVTVAQDVAGPTSAAPVQAFVVPALATRSTARVRFSWPAAGDPTGVTGYDVQLSTDGHAYSPIVSNAPGLSITRFLTLGHTYRARVRSIDGAGNAGAWVSGPSLALRTWQTPSFTYRGTWRVVLAGTSAGTGYRYSTAKASTASITVTARNVAWLAPKNSASGKAAVYVDGVYVTTVNLYSATSRIRQVVFAATFATRGSHTITIRNLGTAGHSRVNLDSLLVLR